MTTATADMESASSAFGSPLFHYLLRYARGRRHVAEDLLQDTMLRAWRGIATMPETHESRRRWLFTIANRVAIDADRARRVRPAEHGGFGLALIGTERSGPETVADVYAVRDALAGLSSIHREVIIDLYFYDHTTAEIAERLGIPEGTVKSRAHYALRALGGALS